MRDVVRRLFRDQEHASSVVVFGAMAIVAIAFVGTVSAMLLFK